MCKSRRGGRQMLFFIRPRRWFCTREVGSLQEASRASGQATYAQNMEIEILKGHVGTKSAQSWHKTSSTRFWAYLGLWGLLGLVGLMGLFGLFGLRLTADGLRLPVDG